MAYYNGNPRTGKPEITRILCDKCGEKEIKFNQYGQQEKPWRWSPLYGDKCHKCKIEC